MSQETIKDFQEVINSYHLLNYSGQNNGPSKILIFESLQFVNLLGYMAE